MERRRERKGFMGVEHEILSREETAELAKRTREGDEEAREKLIKHNLRLVASQAIVYAKKTGIPAEDLFQEGCIGLMRAIEKFDETRGTFSTYAVCWIKQAILHKISNYLRNIRLPAYQVGRISEFTRRRERAWRERGEISNDSDESIAKEMGLNEKKRNTLRDAMRADRTSISLDCLMRGEREDITIGDAIRAKSDETGRRLEQEDEVNHLLENLPKREQKILRLYFGITDGRERTLRETGRVFHLSRERIRQIVSGALKKIREERGIPEPPKERKRQRHRPEA